VGAGSSQAWAVRAAPPLNLAGYLDLFASLAIKQVVVHSGKDSFPENENSKEQQPH